MVEALLLDDASGLQRIITKSPQGLHQQLDFLAAFTSCRGVTALHVCTEFNCVKCARVLIESGADVNATAACDADGMGGQTPIFHAVNSIFKYFRPVMELLAEAGADLQVKLRSQLWGEAMSWETVFYDATPISYAQCGMYRQFYRREDDIYSNLQYLYRRAYNTEAVLRNVPNKYLVEGH